MCAYDWSLTMATRRLFDATRLPQGRHEECSKAFRANAEVFQLDERCTCGIHKWLYTNCTKQFDGFKTCVDAFLKALKPNVEACKMVHMFICEIPQWLHNICAKQCNGFRTLVNAVLEVSESKSKHFKLYNCLHVSSSKGFRVVTWSTPMSSGPMWMFFKASSSHSKNFSWSEWINLNTTKWLQNDCKMHFDWLKADMYTVLKDSEHVHKSFHWERSGPIWVLFSKPQCTYRNNSDGIYVYAWIPQHG